MFVFLLYVCFFFLSFPFLCFFLLFHFISFRLFLFLFFYFLPECYQSGSILVYFTCFCVPYQSFIRIPLYFMGRNPELFDDPLEFRPDRWLRTVESRPASHAFASLPFGFGTRMCLGKSHTELVFREGNVL